MTFVQTRRFPSHAEWFRVTRGMQFRRDVQVGMSTLREVSWRGRRPVAYRDVVTQATNSAGTYRRPDWSVRVVTRTLHSEFFTTSTLNCRPSASARPRNPERATARPRLSSSPQQADERRRATLKHVHRKPDALALTRIPASTL